MIIILKVVFHPNTMGQEWDATTENKQVYYLRKCFIDPNTNHSPALPSYRKPKEVLNEMLKLMPVLSSREFNKLLQRNSSSSVLDIIRGR